MFVAYKRQVLFNAVQDTQIYVILLKSGGHASGDAINGLSTHAV